MTSPFRALLTCIAALSMLFGYAQAHHSVEGQFDVNERISLTGTVSHVDWINPHVYVYLDVTNDDGTVTTWGLETGPTARLRRGGLTSQALAGTPGEQITAVGMPARREGNNSIWLIKIAYEDGKYYILHGSPVELPASE
ncbi:MAG: DUF6152 family protein [Rhodospirillaceae bacterium]|nr:DUF6152 family protein [Rhodospirillaceae bacterium]